MKKQMFTGVSASLILTLGLLSSSRASQPAILPSGGSTQALGTLNANNSSRQFGPVLLTAVKVGEPQTADPNPQEVVSNLQSHTLAGREAVTVYLKKLPILTFLGNPVAGDKANPAPKVATKTVPAGKTLTPLERAAALTGRLNQLARDDFDANQIQVSWQPQQQTYVIKAGQEVLLTLNSETLAPNSNRDLAQDALRITNLLRQQLGGAPALTSIIGRSVAQQIASRPTSQVIALGPVRMQIVGEASWYGPGFHGNLTANGERFDQYAMTAAHRTLPFGTRVRVTNLDNGRSVVVRVNDRGPFSGGRVLDLSKAAAQVLGVIHTGVARVRLDVLQ